MRKLIRDEKIITDSWTYLPIAEGEKPSSSVPKSGDIIVPLLFWNNNKDSLLNKDGKLGLVIDGDTEPESFLEDIRHFDLIAIRFPKFADGRGYSTARLLRERFDFKGELRAIGDVLRDQLFYLHRCGFNAFEIRKDRDLADALRAYNEFTVTYQADTSQPLPIYHRN